jgi:hypothetical protein
MAAPVATSRDAALATAAALVRGTFVDPIIAVVDAGASGGGLTGAVQGIAVASIPVAGPVDPVSLVDEVVGLVYGRFRLTVPDVGDGALAIHLDAGDGALDATVASRPASTEATAPPATVAAARVAQTAPTITTAPVTSAAAPASSDSSRSDLIWWIFLGGLGLVVLVGAALVTQRHRRHRRASTTDAGPWAPPAAGARSSTLPGMPTPRVPRTVYFDIAKASRAAEPTHPGSGVEPAEVVDTRSNGHATNDASTPADELYAKRRRVLALADELGNISEACRIVGVSRRSFYEWKRIAEQQGTEALYPKRGR